MFMIFLILFFNLEIFKDTIESIVIPDKILFDKYQNYISFKNLNNFGYHATESDTETIQAKSPGLNINKNKNGSSNNKIPKNKTDNGSSSSGLIFHSNNKKEAEANKIYQLEAFSDVNIADDNVNGYKRGGTEYYPNDVEDKVDDYSSSDDNNEIFYLNETEDNDLENDMRTTANDYDSSPELAIVMTTPLTLFAKPNPIYGQNRLLRVLKLRETFLKQITPKSFDDHQPSPNKLIFIDNVTAVPNTNILPNRMSNVVEEQTTKKYHHQAFNFKNTTYLHPPPPSRNRKNRVRNYLSRSFQNIGYEDIDPELIPDPIKIKVMKTTFDFMQNMSSSSKFDKNPSEDLSEQPNAESMLKLANKVFKHDKYHWFRLRNPIKAAQRHNELSRIQTSDNNNNNNNLELVFRDDDNLNNEQIGRRDSFNFYVLPNSNSKQETDIKRQKNSEEKSFLYKVSSKANIDSDQLEFNQKLRRMGKPEMQIRSKISPAESPPNVLLGNIEKIDLPYYYDIPIPKILPRSHKFKGGIPDAKPEKFLKYHSNDVKNTFEIDQDTENIIKQMVNHTNQIFNFKPPHRTSKHLDSEKSVISNAINFDIDIPSQNLLSKSHKIERELYPRLWDIKLQIAKRQQLKKQLKRNLI